MGGAVYTTSQSNFNCDSCNFTNNSAKQGGALYIENSSRITISSSNFDGNFALENGSAIYITSSKTDPKSYIQSTTFTNNQVGGFGSIFLFEAFLELDNIKLENNLTSGQTSGITLIMSEITLSNSEFYRQVGKNGSCIYLSNNSVANIDNCTIDNVEAEE